MRYKKVIPAQLVRRENRFIATVTVDGAEETVHVKNTGRCRELLIPGCRVYLSLGDNPARKTKYDLVAVEKIREDGSRLLINMDSAAPNAAVGEWLAGGLFSRNAAVRPECKFGNSRFDFFVEDGERRAFVEVKGVTLESGGVAAFPDAPTERGVKHLCELKSALMEGYEAYALFVIQMKGMTLFRPNEATHKAFADALRACSVAGVRVIAMDCIVEPDSMVIDSPVAVDLAER